MGVTYKLKPEIEAFILEKKRENIRLACRELSNLVKERFSLQVSKSSVNFAIRKHGLSMPVGRKSRSLKTSRLAGMGIILLKAADYLIGGLELIVDLIKPRLNAQIEDVYERTEYLLYSRLVHSLPQGKINFYPALCFLTDKRFSSQEIDAYLAQLQSEERPQNNGSGHLNAHYLEESRRRAGLNLPYDLGGTELLQDIYQRLLERLKFCSYFKVEFNDSKALYLDSQRYAVWPDASSIPPDLSTPLYDAKRYINRVLTGEQAMVLFMAPEQGLNRLLKEAISRIGLYNNSGELETISRTENSLPDNGRGHLNVPYRELPEVEPLQRKSIPLVFGLWPWQFSDKHRIVQSGQFKKIYLSPLRKSLYIAEIEVELSQSDDNTKVTLRGCALRTEQTGQIKVIILTNLPTEGKDIEYLVKTYLEKWPDLEDSYDEFNRKKESFTYLSDTQRVTDIEMAIKEVQPPKDIIELLDAYLQALELFVEWQFLPEGKDKKEIYPVTAKIRKEEDYIRIIFPEYWKYTCQRINEREIKLFADKRVYCTSRTIP